MNISSQLIEGYANDYAQCSNSDFFDFMQEVY
jgi:hypothetical protein